MQIAHDNIVYFYPNIFDGPDRGAVCRTRGLERGRETSVRLRDLLGVD